MIYHRKVIALRIIAINKSLFLSLAVAFAFGSMTHVCTAERPTEEPSGPDLLRKHCFDCHGEGAEEGGFALTLADTPDSQNSDGELLESFQRAHGMIARGIMPPVEAERPGSAEKEKMLDWLSQRLMAKQQIGVTPPRRLSRREYQQTLRDSLGISDFQLHAGFPSENTRHGFDNHGTTLVTAGSHLEAYAMTARRVADRLFPPPQAPQPARTFVIEPDNMVISYSSAAIVDGAMRLASSNPLPQRNATWPSRFVAPQRGDYRVELVVSSKNPPPGAVPVLTLAASDGPKSDMRELTRIDVNSEQPTSHTCVVRLDRGQTIFFRYANGPFDYQNASKLRTFMTDLFAKQPELAIAWHRLKRPARGGSGWLQLEEMMRQLRMESDVEYLSQPQLKRLLDDIVRKKVDSGETLVYKFFDQGPNIGIHQVTISGPTTRLPDQSVLQARELRHRLMQSVEANVEPADATVEALRDNPLPWLRALLTKLFRRPPTDLELDQYQELVREESMHSDSPAAGLHLAVRTALMSPNFLYRSLGGPGANARRSDYELASRLSYFLTSGPPDAKLMNLATTGKLRNTEVLSAEVQRLVGLRFAEDFTRQWLRLKTLDTLMPDSRVINRFDEQHRSSMRRETTETFYHVLAENLPVADLISPNFMFADDFLAREIYDLDVAQTGEDGKLRRLSIPRHSRHGGLLGMAAVMTATANGVDTQPVLRGVWVLENIFGTPPPEPPDAVPALTPETTGATTPRERLALHMSESKCAVCHHEIDPLGFALENFDPIGRWRDHYPRYVSKNGESIRMDGPPIDSAGQMPNRVELTDVRDLKRWLYENPQPLARCLAEKWLVYATGRDLNFRERSIVANIVRQQQQGPGNLRTMDLLKAIVNSPIFHSH